jgi:hypothetical protein
VGRRVFFKERSVYVTLNRKEENIETRSTFIVMENG